MDYPDIISDIDRVETIASGPSVRDRRRLAEQYGEHRRGQWRKMKGFAYVRLPNIRSGVQRFTGTRHMGSAGETSR